ncbi:hypothetical protein O0L34_g2308 [Tuta absoluta]|nr:hypothetical protein O0L34_g2308 [Tuta absoluta]
MAVRPRRGTVLAGTMDNKGRERGILKLEPRPRVPEMKSELLSPQAFWERSPSSPQPSVDRLSVTWAEPEPGTMASSANLCHLPSEPGASEVKFPSAGDGSDDEDYSASLSAVLRQRRASVRRSRKGRMRRPSSPFPLDEPPRGRRRSSVFTTSSGDTAISMEESQPAVVTQEQIFENIHLHKEVLGSVKQQPLGMRRKLKLVHQAKAYIKKHQGQLQERLAQSKSTRDIYARFNILLNTKWQQLKREAANTSNLLIPWELRIKEIESHFGSVVASYFTFLRWLFWVNLVIAFILLVFVIVPECLTANPHQDGERKKIMDDEKRNATNLLTLWEFEGVLKVSPIFYGYYSNVERKQYRMPLAYFLTGLVVYIFSFVAILRKMAENSRMSKLSEKEDECIFSWKLFTGWDFMIGNAETAHNRIASVILSFKEALLEEAEKKKDVRNWRIISLRALVNVAVVILLVASAWAVVTVVTRPEDETKPRSWWTENESSTVVTSISIVFPFLFELLGLLEHYHPRKQLRLQLARIMLLNLLNLYSLMFALFSKIQHMSTQLDGLKPTLTVNATIPSNSTLFFNESFAHNVPTICTERIIACEPCLLHTLPTDLTTQSTTTSASYISSVIPITTTPSSLKPNIANISQKYTPPTVSTNMHNSLDTKRTMTPLPSVINVKIPKKTRYGPNIDKSEKKLLPQNLLEKIDEAATTPGDHLEKFENIETTTENIREIIEIILTATEDPIKKTQSELTTTDNLAEVTEDVLTTTEDPVKKILKELREKYPDNEDTSESFENESDPVSFYDEETSTETTLENENSDKSSTFSNILDNDNTTSSTFDYSTSESDTSTGSEDYISSKESFITLSDTATSNTSEMETEGITESERVSTITEYITMTESNAPYSEDSFTLSNTDTSIKSTIIDTTIPTMPTKSPITFTNPVTLSTTNEVTESFNTESDYSITTTDVSTVATNPRATCPNISFNCTITCDGRNVTQVFKISNCSVVEKTCYVTECVVQHMEMNITMVDIVYTVQYESKAYNQYNLTTKTRKQLLKLCWETMFGQELVKLTMMDLVFVLFGTLFMDFFRALFVRYMNGCWCWDLEKSFPEYGDFKIAENILHLINNQGMVWMGMFFSPGLVVLNVCKLMILMYLRSWAVMTCNVPHEVVFRVSKSNNFYLALLLTMLFLCVLPVGYTIVWVKPSWHCGPFSEYDKIYYIFTNNLYNLLPKSVNFALEYVASPATVIPLLVLLVLIIYYLTSLTNSLREANNDLKIQLRRERTEERRKMFKLADTRRAGSASALDNTPFARWKKALPAIPLKSIDSDDRKTVTEEGEPVKATRKRGGGLLAKIVGLALDKKTEESVSDDVPPSPSNYDDETDNTDFHEALPREVLSLKDITFTKPQQRKRNSVEFKTEIADKLTDNLKVKIDKDERNEKRPDRPEVPPIEEEYKEDEKQLQRRHTSDSTTSKQSDSFGSVIPVITISTTESDDEQLHSKNETKKENKKESDGSSKKTKSADAKSLRRQSSVDSAKEHKPQKEKKDDVQKYQHSL